MDAVVSVWNDIVEIDICYTASTHTRARAHILIHSVDSVYTITSARIHKCFGRFVQIDMHYEQQKVPKASAAAAAATTIFVYICVFLSLSYDETIVSNKRHNKQAE